LGPRDAVDDHHDAGAAVRARPQRLPGQCLEPVAVVGGWIGCRFSRRHPEQFPTQRQLLGTMRVAEEAEVTDAVKSVRQHMDQEAADELRGREAHRLPAIVVPVILPVEAHLAIVHGHQAVVGDGNAMGVAPDIVENLFRSGERPLGIDDPIGVPGRRQVTAECGRLMQVAVRGEEVQLPADERLLQVAQEQSRNIRDSTLTGRKNPGRQAIQLCPSGAMPPPGTRK